VGARQTAAKLYQGANAQRCRKTRPAQEEGPLLFVRQRAFWILGYGLRVDEFETCGVDVDVVDELVILAVAT
jgi:hypothetical protein